MATYMVCEDTIETLTNRLETLEDIRRRIELDLTYPNREDALESFDFGIKLMQERLEAKRLESKKWGM